MFSDEAGGLLAGYAEGSQIAGYRLEKRVGAGGMAVVFRARDERLGRRVALKILAPGVAADEAFRQRFIRESQAAAAVDDPHIIPVFEAGEADGVLFIAMRYVPGGDVRSLVRRAGSLPPGRGAAIVSPVASALDAAHAAGLVHRDVKPANMLVDLSRAPGSCVFVGFRAVQGCAALTRADSIGPVPGNPGYTAPEQIEGKPADGRADQYSLGCAAFELLGGEPPFPRDHVTAVIWAHMSELPPPLTSRRPGLPAAVDGVLARALAKAPTDRYASCREFADALRIALGLEPYSSGSGTAPKKEMIDPLARGQAPPMRVRLLGQPRSSAYVTTAGRKAVPTVDPAPRPPIAVGEKAQPVTSYREDGDHPGRGLGRRKLLVGAAACSAAAALGGLTWDLKSHYDNPQDKELPRNDHAAGPVLGTTIWHIDLPFKPQAQQVNLVLGGKVLYAAGATEMFALSADDGTHLWSLNGPSNGGAANHQIPGYAGIKGIAASRETVYISPTTSDDLEPSASKLYALGSSDGKTLWAVVSPGNVTVVADGAAYVSGDLDNPPSLYAFRASDGTRIWQFPAEIASEPLVNAGIVYFLSGFRSPYLLRAVQASDGKQIWASPAPGGEGRWQSAATPSAPFTVRALPLPQLYGHGAPATGRSCGNHLCAADSSP